MPHTTSPLSPWHTRRQPVVTQVTDNSGIVRVPSGVTWLSFLCRPPPQAASNSEAHPHRFPELRDALAGSSVGAKMSDSVGQYLNEIGLVPLLTAQEERELSQVIEKGAEAAARIEAGERGRELQREVRRAAEAKDRFIRANLRLVVSVARRYPLPPGMELLDLIQEGNLGLEHAVDKFDWRKGFKFSTYATFWIRQAIGRALDQKASLVRLPGDRSASLRAALRQVSGDGDELDDEHARLHRLTTPTSLDRTIGDDDSNELIDLLADANPGPEQDVMARFEEQMITDLLSVLDPRAKYAVEQRFGLTDGRKRSYREVGEELGVTAEAARRLVKRAVNTVREQAPDVVDIDAA